MKRLPQNDIDHILLHAKDIWKDLRQSKIFITGGTGFIGKWLLESFLAANEKFLLDASVTVLSRNPGKFARTAPHLATHPAIHLIEGDVRSFTFPKGNFTHVIHGAVDASLKLVQEQPQLISDTIIEGTKKALEFAGMSGAKKTLVISSGAVYGRQPADVRLLPEEYTGTPELADRYAIYGKAKRAAEMLCSVYAKQHEMETVIARCFAFVGPYLPLDAHYAVGNFIRDVLNGKPVRIEGDGTAQRSYLYAADLAIWLWTILIRGRSLRAYNVGSENVLSLAEIAGLVAECDGNALQVIVARKPDNSKPLDVYAPCTKRARTELGLKETINLREAIEKTIEFYRK